ncbi:MAG: amino acid ABC transporter ATP-binding protein [Candidatus Berkiellales bacterium]
MLNIIDVSKQYAKQAVLNNINFAVEKGSVIGLAGHSGSGKSTLLRSIQKLENINSGQIQFSGTCSYMFQDFQLFPHMTVLENLCYAPKRVFNMDRSHSSKCEKEALDLLTELGISDKAGSYPLKLSGGQKQRVALARCLMMKPNILLCDEPTSGLDVVTVKDVIDLLAKVHTLGVTMVIASHDLDFLTKIASRIIVLKHGSKVADVELGNLDDPVNYLKKLYDE